ncbi:MULTISPECIES: DUF342 domain-containing protein [Bacillus]|uniref:DUF342 domain-containing protein n=1 Tax=Bacillus TaxID=1386 RepID=UPI0011A97070|nr:DUF342 domain-containing protein [Bacillus subtilis]MBT2165582.1 hypothetical protein [Bacillus subtilis]MDD9765690.1 hypothetical protein [Bacillus subtilis]MDD9768646.1 hypothetical protein [Bacillus subtilis]MDD9772587.1 hypothetical protein [Bacillus subtilis]MDD9776888.1 hypothetical protein [Bacillus subtilis]
MANGLKLLEGTKNDRDKYIKRTDVLDKVKKVVLLKDGEHMTVKMVADFYEVELKTIQSVMNRNKAELDFDGVETLKGQGLKVYKSTYLQGEGMYKKIARLNIIPRQAVLRIGMLLTDSEVASKVRDYLLEIEKNTARKDKESTLKFLGTWNKELDDFVFKYIQTGIKNSIPIRKSMKELSSILEVNYGLLHSRWYTGDKVLKPLRHRLDKQTLIKVSKGEHLKNNKQYTDDCFIHSSRVNEQIANSNEQYQELKQVCNRLLNGINSVYSQNERDYTRTVNIYKIINQIKTTQEQHSKAFDEIHKKIDHIEESLEERKEDKIIELNKELHKVKQKLKTANKDNKKLSMHISRLTILNEDTDFQKDINSTAFKMERNGNLTKMY